MIHSPLYPSVTTIASHQPHFRKDIQLFFTTYLTIFESYISISNKLFQHCMGITYLFIAWSPPHPDFPVPSTWFTTFLQLTQLHESWFNISIGQFNIFFWIYIYLLWLTWEMKYLLFIFRLLRYFIIVMHLTLEIQGPRDPCVMSRCFGWRVKGIMCM